MGAWSIAAADTDQYAAGQGASGLHYVYTQPDAVQAYRDTGYFPDGTVIIKELFVGATKQMTTGTVSRGTNVEGWFILVKDAENRFPENPLWGDGWGWVLYSVEDVEVPVTRSYIDECLACHTPARDTDWVYVEGYPVLGSER